jgi:oligopeptide transport system ATP-binding protein
LDMGEATVLLDVQGLRKHFPVPNGRGLSVLRAVDGVSFALRRGEVMGLVGESGSGKSTVGRLILRLHEPTEGSVLFDGADLGTLGRRPLRQMRRRMQMIFQDPYSSLNPYMRVRDVLLEALTIHRLGGTPAGRAERVAVLLDMVGLPAGFAGRFPHELSGGQRQRVSIARALAVEPELIIADEAVSALDVSNQAQIINVLMELQERFGLTLLFISHNLAVVRNIADMVGVMYLGRMMELAPTEALFDRPLHPYTAALLSSVPVPDPGAAHDHVVLTGEIPSPISPPSGCVFRTRCPLAEDRCAGEVPPLRDVGDGRKVACLVV